MIDAFRDFAGQGLTFAISGPGVSVDSATGLLAVSSEALVSGLEVVVRASNSGETSESRFRLTVTPLEAAAEPPVAVGAPALRGSGEVGSEVTVDPGQWTGAPAPELALQWRLGGVAIDGATGTGFVPGPGEDGAELDCLVTATNAAGSVALAAGPLRVREVPPAALEAIADLELRLGAAPGKVQAARHFAGGALSFSVTGAGATVDAASGEVSVPATALLAGEPVVVTARNSGGSVSSQFRVSVTPAKLDPGLLQISEITDPADPAIGKGGRRRLLVGEVTIPSGYELRWSSPTEEGGVPPGTLVTANTTFVRNNSLETGSVNYNVFYWYRQSDGACFNALPPSGRTGNGKAITPTALNPADGQVILTIGQSAAAPAPAWSSLGVAAVADATRFPLAEFANKGGTGSNITQSRNAYVAAAYESFRGTTSTDAFVTAQLDRLLDGKYMPAGMSGPAAAREASAITFFQLVKLTPRLYDTLSDTKKSQMEWIVRALLVVHAWMGSDSHPDGPGGSDWFLTGFDDGVGVKSVGPNIAFGLVANIVNAACYLGPLEARNFLDTVTMSDLRARIGSLFGTSSLLYRTLNWRNEGVSASAATSFYRAAASSLAPSDATVEGALRSFRYYGAALPDLQAILFPNGTRGLNRCIPPAHWADRASNPYVGIAQHSALGNAGLMIGTTIHGTCLNKATGMPHLGDVGCMIYELNGIDEGGLRSSMGYASWTKAVVDCVILSLAVSEAIDLTSPVMADFLIRWNKASEIVNYFDDNDYRSCSHNQKDSSGKVIGTKPGGPGKNLLWSADRDLFAMPAHRALWEAIRARLAIPSA